MWKILLPRLALLILDCLLIEAAFYGTYLWRFQSGQFTNPVGFSASELFTPSLVVLVYWVFVLTWFGLYRFDPLRPRSLIVRDATAAIFVGALVLFMLTFSPEDPLPRTRIILFAYGVCIFLIVAGNRVGLSSLLRQLRFRGWIGWNVLIVGAIDRAQSIANYIGLHPELGFRVQSLLVGMSENAASVSGKLWIDHGLYRLRSAVRAQRIEMVILAPGDEQERQLNRLLRFLRDLPVRTFITSDRYAVLLGEVKPARLRGHPLIEVRPELLAPAERFFKRTFDIAAGVIFLLLSLPLWIVFAILIKLESPGPVIFAQERVGLDGRIFTLLKFRSMFRDAEAESGAVLASKNDPRVTKFGRFLRTTRLDELPQLLNVIIGQMSIVGPRPERMEFVRRFSREIPLYERRLNVKPGITGWSQVHLKYDSAANQVPIKLRHDLYYIENMSLPLDIKILAMTLFVILRGEGQ